MIVINDRLRIPLRELQITLVRSSGPGGQNVNKVSTKAVVRWQVMGSPSLPEQVRQRLLSMARGRVTDSGELVMTSQRFRDAGRNVADCLEKLRQLLSAAAAVPKRRRATRPTRASTQRRLEGKRQQSQKKRQRRPDIEP